MKFNSRYLAPGFAQVSLAFTEYITGLVIHACAIGTHGHKTDTATYHGTTE